MYVGMGELTTFSTALLIVAAYIHTYIHIRNVAYMSSSGRYNFFGHGLIDVLTPIDACI